MNSRIQYVTDTYFCLSVSMSDVPNTYLDSRGDDNFTLYSYTYQISIFLIHSYEYETLKYRTASRISVYLSNKDLN